MYFIFSGEVHIGLEKPEALKKAITYLYTGKIHKRSPGSRRLPPDGQLEV